MSEDKYSLSTRIADMDPDKEDDDTRSWITIFADIALLLLVFFVLLFSFSTLSDEKFRETILSVRSSLGQKDTEDWGIRVRTDTSGVLMDMATQFRQLREAQQQAFADIQYYQNEKGIEGIVGARLDQGKITLTLPSEVLFDLGEVDLKPQGKKVLQDMKDIFNRHPEQRINIEGHTDNIPPRQGGRFEDNWEISSLRALNALRFLMQEGIDPGRMTATGYADLQPLYPNTTEGNRARNRRVEFVLERHIGG
ncbi:OmpA family protein [Desulfonatronospira sp.]|uniref:OmpA/MotB family protein n=1 Tax=Desulfonatronospira sp. TaxID=1962951 RepID=UPI0025C5A202|nr:OmpA family protein [Desulfonatronospira sp.]